MIRACHFSPCRRYRYTLWREWDPDLLTGCADDSENASRFLMVIGLNPSTADETNDDPTIRRCIGFAKRWGYGALCMTNLFAFRATDPEVMKRSLAPEGETIDSHTSVNCRWLLNTAKEAGMILAAWGKHGSYRDRAQSVLRMLDLYTIHALTLNSDGSPKHPLYVAASTKPVILGKEPQQ